MLESVLDLHVSAFCRLKETFSLRILACQFALSPGSFCLLTGFADGRLFEMLLEPHFAEHAFTLQFFFKTRSA